MYICSNSINLHFLRRTHWSSLYQASSQNNDNDISKSQCQQPNPLFPYKGDKRLDEMYEYLSTDEFQENSIGHLAGAVQMRTESFDDMGPIGEDSRWDIMYEFAKYLKDTFPRVHEYMSPEIVNTHGLVYTWEGSDEGLKPLLLLAHQDASYRTASIRNGISADTLMLNIGCSST